MRLAQQTIGAGFLALALSTSQAPVRNPAPSARATANRAEAALQKVGTDAARAILTPLLEEERLAALPRKERARIFRVAGDIERIATRGSEAERLYRSALRQAEPEARVLSAEIVRAQVGLALIAHVLSESTVVDAHLKLAERHLAGAGDEARAVFLEGVAATRAVGSCEYPCRLAFDGLGSTARQAFSLASEAVALRRRLQPGSEGQALRLRAFARFRTQDASREEILEAHEDLLESIRLLGADGGSRFDLAEALRAYASAMDNATGQGRDMGAVIEAATAVLPSEDTWSRFRLAFEIAQLRLRRRDPGHRQWSCLSMEVPERIYRWVRPDRESRAGFANHFTRGYSAGADVLFDAQGAEAGVRAVELIRGRLLATVLAGRRTWTPELERESGALFAEQRDLLRRMVARDGTLEPEVIARIWELGAALDEPHLRARPAPPPARLSDDLPPGALLLYFPFTTQRFYVLERGHDVREVQREMEYQEVWPLMLRFRQLLENPASDPSAITEIASTLYEGLLGAVDKDIERSERLIISTDGNLEHIPFSALLRVRGADARFLGTWKPISNVLSLSVRRELRNRAAAPPDGGVAVFANPEHPAFDDLPDASREGARIATAWGSRARLYTGKDVTRDALFREFGQARVLHIATHGISNAAFALGTGLVVTPKGGDDDGVLRAWELIHQPPLRADLVVLSGCNTGPGASWFAMGEGSFDLSRHFLEAGAGAVLSASWRISDEATSTFMTSFHRGLLQGLSADLALTAAQTEMSNAPRWAHPFNWAAFRLVGLGDLPMPSARAFRSRPGKLDGALHQVSRAIVGLD